MASQVFLAPCSKQDGDSRAYRNLLHTVAGGVNLDEYSADSKRSGELAVWGLVEGNSNQWANIEEGDYLLFYVGDETYEYAARVLDKEKNTELAKQLWPNYRKGGTGGDDPGDLGIHCVS